MKHFPVFTFLAILATTVYAQGTADTNLPSGEAATGPIAAHSLAPAPLTASDLKVLNGPVADFSFMRLPSIKKSGNVSRGRLIPVELTTDGKGNLAWQGQILADAGHPFSLLVLRPVGHSWDVELQDPSGRWFRADDLRRLDPEAAWQKAGEHGSWLHAIDDKMEAFRLSTAGAGEWQVVITSQDQGSAKASSGRGLLWLENGGPWRLRSHLSSWRTVVGEPVTARAELIDDNDLELDLAVTEASATLVDSEGVRTPLAVAADRSVTFDPPTAGLYQIEIDLMAKVAPGVFIRRSVQQPVTVIDPPLRFDIDGPAGLRKVVLGPDDRFSGKLRLRFDVPLAWTKSAQLPASGPTAPTKVLAWAEVWGRDANGVPIPAAWVGGMVLVEPGADGAVLPLSLDQRWLQRAATDGPYELRRLRLQDPDTSIPYAFAERLPVDSLVPANWSSTKGAFADLEIDEEMLAGPRPASLSFTEDTKNHRPRETLVLVHGYCSEAVWKRFVWQFQPGVRRFKDHEIARSNDAFALQIRSDMVDFSGSSPFSTISHSQGGMAALHLLNFYWSGLDNSYAVRPLQSVGTPFNGSVLMNVWSILHHVLPNVHRCSPVTDLTTGGAARWLAGISSASRNKAYYYRTRGRRILGPCDWLASTFIPGKDDGVVSVSEGRLPGGHSLGVKSRQCHTNTMRHRFHLDDWNRNRTMAARGRTYLPDPVDACFSTSLSRSSAPANLTLNASCTRIREGRSPSYRFQVQNLSTGRIMTYTGRHRIAHLGSPGTYRVTLTVAVSGPTFSDSSSRTVHVNRSGSGGGGGGGGGNCSPYCP